jgi:hypothetical protein
MAVREHPDSEARAAAVKKLTDQAALAEIAKNDTSWAVRAAAVKNITDQAVLVEIVENDCPGSA